MRPIYGLLGGSLLCAVLALTTGPVLFGCGPPVGVALAIAALWLVAARAHRFAIDAGATWFGRPGAFWVALAGALVILVGQLALTWRALSVMRSVGKSQVSAANLRGIGFALRMYHDKYGEHPESLAHLVRIGLLGPGSCVCPYDEINERQDLRDGYTSYVYQRGAGAWRNEPELILAYERFPWSRARSELFSSAAFNVLFGDLSTRCLDVNEMTAAWHQDFQRRREIGWSTPAPGDSDWRGISVTPAPALPSTRPP